MNTTTITASDPIGAWLEEIHVPATHVDQLDLDLIDDRASLANQARHEPIIEEVVDRYIDDMKRGDRFPPVIVRKHPRGTKYTVLSGNHRVAAARNAGATLAAYIVECSDEIALRITYEDNRRHGLPPSEAERLDQALHLMALGWTQAAAAAAVGVSESKLQRARDTARFDARARQVGVDGVDNVPASLRARLVAVRSDPVFEAVTRLVAEAALNGDQVAPLITGVNKARSEAEALELVELERERRLERIQQRATGKTVKRGPTPRGQLMSALTQIAMLRPDELVAAVSPDQRRDLSKRLNQAAVKLIEIDKAIRS